MGHPAESSEVRQNKNRDGVRTLCRSKVRDPYVTA